jgi:hypothetical protein
MGLDAEVDYLALQPNDCCVPLFDCIRSRAPLNFAEDLLYNINSTRFLRDCQRVHLMKTGSGVFNVDC